MSILPEFKVIRLLLFFACSKDTKANVIENGCDEVVYWYDIRFQIFMFNPRLGQKILTPMNENLTIYYFDSLVDHWQHHKLCYEKQVRP